jgi:uncharacterized protein YybS (DUF2232 family)
MATAVETNHRPNKSSPLQSVGKLVALCAFAAMMSTFGPFALVAPAAIALAFIHYGVGRVFLAVSIMTVGLYFLGGQNVSAFGSIITFAYSSFVGFAIDRLITYKVHPVKGVLYGGVGFYLIALVFTTCAIVISGTSLNEVVGTQVNFFIEQMQKSPEYNQIISAGGDQARELQNIVKSPEEMVKQIVNWIPSVVFISILLSLWASFYFVLRNSLAWRSQRKYPFGLLHLTFFKLPFWIVYPLIVALALSLIGNSVEGYDFSVVGFNLLYSLGALYFFQGFGVVYDYFTVKGYRGFFKSLMVTLAVVFMWRLVVLIGLLDIWINFRKFYVKKIEGDK